MGHVLKPDKVMLEIIEGIMRGECTPKLPPLAAKPNIFASRKTAEKLRLSRKIAEKLFFG